MDLWEGMAGAGVGAGVYRNEKKKAYSYWVYELRVG
jgi:hypothetical protein